MAATFDGTTYTGTNSALGVTTGSTFVETAATSALGLTGVSLNGTITTPGTTVPATVSLAGIPVTATATYTGFTTDASGNPVYVFSLAGAPGLVGVSVAVSPSGTVPTAGVTTTLDTTATTDAPPVCFVKGTHILTDRGEVAVEDLRPGDLVATAAQDASPDAPAFRPVRFVGVRRYDLTVAGNEIARPVRVRAGALGNGLPHRDLLVSADHSLFLDGRLVPVKFLVNGSSITVETTLAEVTYFHIELDSHDLLFSEGALSESWLDNGNRARFSNALVVALHPTDETPRAWNEGACHPHLIDGPELAVLHARLAILGEQFAADTSTKQDAVAA